MCAQTNEVKDKEIDRLWQLVYFGFRKKQWVKVHCNQFENYKKILHTVLNSTINWIVQNIDELQHLNINLGIHVAIPPKTTLSTLCFRDQHDDIKVDGNYGNIELLFSFAIVLFVLFFSLFMLFYFRL